MNDFDVAPLAAYLKRNIPEADGTPTQGMVVPSGPGIRTSDNS